MSLYGSRVLLLLLVCSQALFFRFLLCLLWQVPLFRESRGSLRLFLKAVPGWCDARPAGIIAAGRPQAGWGVGDAGGQGGGSPPQGSSDSVVLQVLN